MIKKLLLLTALFAVITSAHAQYDATIYHPAKPIAINRQVNIALEARVQNQIVGTTLNSITVDFDKTTPLDYIEKLSVYYTGTASSIHSNSINQAFVTNFNILGGGQQIFANPSYSILKATDNVIKPQMQFQLSQPLAFGDNYFFVSVTLKPNYPLTEPFNLNISRITVNKKPVELKYRSSGLALRAGVIVRDAGDDGVHTYRIPALVTAADGTLLASYDVRRCRNDDLQENVQVGLSRSEDGGQTWQPMQLIMDMRGVGGLPDSQNGVGDPALLVDSLNGDVYAMAMWTHGIGGNRAWWGVTQGTDYRKGAAQVLITKSSDNGKTWSKPYNITRQIKDSTWFILLQGPGRGITMRNGTLVFPFQYVDSARMPHATIVYSNDKGVTWTIGKPARSNTTEAQVIELPTGELMLNMRDNRGESRAILTTTDMGKTWSEHPSSRSALQEPVCMASLIEVPAQQNVLNKDLLLFSNPNTPKTRSHITIKASLDNGLTWLPENQLLLDQEPNWGYSCLTMINPETVGILYESSVGQLLFQAIPLKDIIKKQ